jgi:hypothetical protein
MHNAYNQVIDRLGVTVVQRFKRASVLLHNTLYEDVVRVLIVGQDKLRDW